MCSAGVRSGLRIAESSVLGLSRPPYRSDTIVQCRAALIDGVPQRLWLMLRLQIVIVRSTAAAAAAVAACSCAARHRSMPDKCARLRSLQKLT